MKLFVDPSFDFERDTSRNPSILEEMLKRRSIISVLQERGSEKAMKFFDLTTFSSRQIYSNLKTSVANEHRNAKVVRNLPHETAHEEYFAHDARSESASVHVK